LFRATFENENVSRCQAKFLTREIADYTPSAHAQSDTLSHAFRRRCLFTEVSSMLTTDTDGLVLEFRNWRARPSEIFFSGYLFPSCRLLGTGQVDIEQKALIFASDLKKLFAKADSFTLRSEETTDIPLRNFW